MKLILLAVFIMTGLLIALASLVLLARSLLIIRKGVTITLNDNRAIATTTGIKLLEALNDADVRIPSACAGAGTCGLCKVTVTAGIEDALPTERAQLSERDVEQGVRLACQLSLHNDMAISIPDSVLTAVRCDAEVVSSRYVSPLIKEITLLPPADSKMPFVAGNFVEVTVPEYQLEFSDLEVDDAFKGTFDALNIHKLRVNNTSEVTRAYSIASRPIDTDKIVLLIRLALPPPDAGPDVPPGIVSSWLFNCRKGDKVKLAGPFGDFRIASPNREMVLIGGGVGMAPLRAMLHEHLKNSPDYPVHFYYGTRHRGEIFYDDEFDALSERHNNFHFTVALSDTTPEEQWQGATGFIHDTVQRDFLDTHPNPDDCDYYLCGPPLMMRAAMAMLADAGVAQSHIHADDFGS